MCLFLRVHSSEFIIFIALILSSYTTIGLGTLIFNSFNTLINHNNSQVAEQAATNSESVEDSVTKDCFLLDQITLFPKTLNKYPEVDFLISISPAKSASTNPTISSA